jgi:IPT/TIG domain/PKD domain
VIVPGGVFVAGYNLGLVSDGQIIPGTVQTVIEGTNTADAGGVQTTPAVNVSVGPVDITDPDTNPGTGDESAADASVTVSYPNQTWTAGASGLIEFREQSDSAITGTTGGGLIVTANLGFIVQFHCSPGTVTGDPPGVIAFTDPAPTFASTQIQAPPAGPDITSLTPSSGPEAGGNSVVIAGTGFTGATAVSFGGTPATSFTVDSATQITATAPAGTGTVDVSVTAGGNTSPNEADDNYTYNPPTANQPPVANAGDDQTVSPGDLVTLDGSGTDPDGDTLTFAWTQTAGGDVALSDPLSAAPTFTAPDTAGTLEFELQVCDVTSTPLCDTDTMTVTVEEPVGDAPVVEDLFPGFAISCFGGLTVITGENFTGATEVLFGDEPAPFFRVLDDEAILAFAPPQRAGKVHVTVTGPGGTSEETRADKFRYIRVPFLCRFFDKDDDDNGDDDNGGEDGDDDGVDDEEESLFGNLLHDSDSDDDGITDGNDDGDGDGEDDEDEDDDDECPDDDDEDGDGEDDEDEDDDEDDD